MTQKEFLDVETFIPALRTAKELTAAKQMVAFSQNSHGWTARLRDPDTGVVLTLKGDTKQSLQWMREGAK